MQRFCQGILLTLLLSTGLALSAHAQNTITIDATTFVTAAALGPGGGMPHAQAWPADPDPAPWTQHLEDIQPGSYVEYVVTTTTPGLYSINVLGSMASPDPATQFSFESRPVTTPDDPYVTRYTTPDSKEYPQWGTFNPRTYAETGKIVDANNTMLTIPLVAGQNIVRLRNISQRHQQALSYPVDYTQPGANVRPTAGRWNNLQLLQITLNREGDLPAYGTVTGTVTGDKPAGVKVRRAWVMANPVGQSPAEPSSWWRWGYNTLSKDDGTYVLKAPVGQQEIKAGRPSSYQVQGSTPIPVTVPATGSATANPTLTSIWLTSILPNDTAYVQAEYFDSWTGQIGLVGDDNARNNIKMGWIDAGDSVSMIVDVPQAGNYEVTSHYSNGGGEGRTRVSTDLGQAVEIVQPAEGWTTQSSRTATGTIYLLAGPNVITQTNLVPNSDLDAVVLRRLDTPVTVGLVHGLITNSVTGQPVANASVAIGTSIINTDASGNYRMLVNGATNIPYTVTAPFQDAPTTGTVSVAVSGDVTLNANISIRPNLVLTTANGYEWKALANTGGTADYSAVGASETGFVPITVPGNINTLATEDDIYAWYRLHLTVPANFNTQIPGRQVVFRVTPINGLTLDDLDQVFVNGTAIGQTGSFPNPPLGVQPAGYVNRVDNTVANSMAPGTEINYREERNYYFPASLLRPGQDNVIAVKIYDFLGGGGISGVPSLSVAPAVGTVSGKVIANGAGVPGVRVAASDASGISNAWTMTDASGSFALTHVLVGPNIIGAAKPGYLTDEKPVTVSPNGTHSLVLSVATVADGVAKLYDDFQDATSWSAKFDAISEANNTIDNAPMIVAGYDVEEPLTAIPSSITIEPVLGQRAGLLTKARFSKFASVNSAKLVSALTSTPEPGGGVAVGGLPNAIMQLISPPSDDPTTVGFSNYIEYDLEGYLNSGTNQRVQVRVWAAGYGEVSSWPVPIPLERLGDLSAANPIEMTITRVGSYFDFYANGIRALSINLPGSLPGDHKIFLYSYDITGRTTWDWVKVTAGPSNIIGPLGKASQALRIAGGLEAAPAAGAAFTALNVATGGDSATKIDILDAVTLAKQGL